MQHDHVLKKLDFDLLIPPPRVGGGGGVCGQTISYHAAAIVIPFNSICNMSMKKLNFDLLTPHSPRVGGSVCGQNICYDVAA